MQLTVLSITNASDTIDISFENALTSFTSHIHGLCSVHVIFGSLFWRPSHFLSIELWTATTLFSLHTLARDIEIIAIITALMRSFSFSFSFILSWKTRIFFQTFTRKKVDFLSLFSFGFKAKVNMPPFSFSIRTFGSDLPKSNGNFSKMWRSRLNVTVYLFKQLHQRRFEIVLNNWLLSKPWLFTNNHADIQYHSFHFCLPRFSCQVFSALLKILKHASALFFCHLNSCFCSKWLGFYHRSRRSHWKWKFIYWLQWNLTDRKVSSRDFFRSGLTILPWSQARYWQNDSASFLNVGNSSFLSFKLFQPVCDKQIWFQRQIDHEISLAQQKTLRWSSTKPLCFLHHLSPLSLLDNVAALVWALTFLPLLDFSAETCYRLFRFMWFTGFFGNCQDQSKANAKNVRRLAAFPSWRLRYRIDYRQGWKIYSCWKWIGGP